MKHSTQRTDNERGSALVMVAILMTGLAAATLFMLVTIGASNREKAASQIKVEATYAAEAALNVALLDMSTGGTGVLGASQAQNFGGSQFSVAVDDIGGDLSSLTATANVGSAESVVEAVVQQTSTSIWAYGAFGDEQLTMASNAMVDSYNSSLGTYDSQDVNGSGSSRFALDDGNIGSNGNIILSQNSDVHGNATPGPSSTATVLGNAEVSGSTTPSPSTVSMPALVAPALTFTGPLSVPNGTIQTLGSGDHAFDTLDIGTGGTLQVTGPATVYVGSAELNSNSQFLVDATAGPVVLYVVDDFVLNSNTFMGSLTFTPADLTVQLESDNIIDPNLTVDLDDVLLESNAQLYGSIYAPNALVDIDSNFELFGAVVARELHLDSNSKIHFDEALSDSSSSTTSTMTVLYSRVVR